MFFVYQASVNHRLYVIDELGLPLAMLELEALTSGAIFHLLCYSVVPKYADARMSLECNGVSFTCLGGPLVLMYVLRIELFELLG